MNVMTIRGSLALAAILIVTGFAIRGLDSAGIIGDGLAERLMGAMIGAMLVVYGNTIPKVLSPLAGSKCSPAQAQNLQRFAGWAFVLGGIGYIICWLVLPMGIAATGAIACVAVSLVVVIGRCLLVRTIV